MENPLGYKLPQLKQAAIALNSVNMSVHKVKLTQRKDLLALSISNAFGVQGKSSVPPAVLLSVQREKTTRSALSTQRAQALRLPCPELLRSYSLDDFSYRKLFPHVFR